MLGRRFVHHKPPAFDPYPHVRGSKVNSDVVSLKKLRENVHIQIPYLVANVSFLYMPIAVKSDKQMRRPSIDQPPFLKMPVR